MTWLGREAGFDPERLGPLLICLEQQERNPVCFEKVAEQWRSGSSPWGTLPPGAVTLRPDPSQQRCGVSQRQHWIPAGQCLPKPGCPCPGSILST